VGLLEIGHHVQPMDEAALIAFEVDAPAGVAAHDEEA